MTGTPVPGAGHLTVRRTYLTVNEPMLFSATNTLGDLLLVSYAEPTDHGEAWILTRVTETRLAQFESGFVDIRDMFRHAETGEVRFVEFNDTTNVTTTRVLNADDPALTPYLPRRGQRIPTPIPAHEQPRVHVTDRYEIQVHATNDPVDLLYRVTVPTPEWAGQTLALVQSTLAPGYQATMLVFTVTTTERVVDRRTNPEPEGDGP